MEGTILIQYINYLSHSLKTPKGTQFGYRVLRRLIRILTVRIKYKNFYKT